MYWEKLSSLVVLLITVEISVARTLYRRFDISEFLTPSTAADQDGDDAKATQAKSAAAAQAQASDFEYEGIHGIAQQVKHAAPVVVNHVTNAAANIGVTSGGVLANIAYQLLNFTKRGISYVGGGTVDKLEQVQNRHRSFMTMTKDAVTNTGNYVVGKLEKISDALDDVAKMSGEEQVAEGAGHVTNEIQHHEVAAVGHTSEQLQEDPPKKKKKKKKSTSSDGKQRRKGRNSNHRDGDKEKKKGTKDVKNGEKKKKKNTKDVKNEQKKKKKRTEKIVDENVQLEEASEGWSIF